MQNIAEKRRNCWFCHEVAQMAFSVKYLVPDAEILILFSFSFRYIMHSGTDLSLCNMLSSKTPQPGPPPTHTLAI